MKRNLGALLVICLHLPSWAQFNVSSPADFLGYELGARFTPHHRMLDYFRMIDEALPNVKVVQYGETYEHRPLIYALVTSPENFRNLEQIRLNNLRRAGLAEGVPPGQDSRCSLDCGSELAGLFPV